MNDIEYLGYEQIEKPKGNIHYARMFIFLSTLFVILVISLSIIFNKFDKIDLIFLYLTSQRSGLPIQILLLISKLFFIVINALLLSNLYIYEDITTFNFIYQNTTYKFCLIQITFSFNFICSFFFSNYNRISCYINIIANCINIIIQLSFYPKCKSQKSMTTTNMICTFIYISCLLSLLTYFSLTLVKFLIRIQGISMSISVDIIQLLIGIVLITLYKDFIFLLMTMYLQIISFLYLIKVESINVWGKGFHFLFIMIFEIVAISLTFKNYKNEALGEIEDHEEMAKILLNDNNQNQYNSLCKIEEY